MTGGGRSKREQCLDISNMAGDIHVIGGAVEAQVGILCVRVAKKDTGKGSGSWFMVSVRPNPWVTKALEDPETGVARWRVTEEFVGGAKP